MWFSKENFLDRHLRGYGCGVVALHDLSVYKGCAGTSKTRDDYREHIRKTEKAGIFVFPYLGIAPYYYSLIQIIYSVVTLFRIKNQNYHLFLLLINFLLYNKDFDLRKDVYIYLN